MRITFLLFASFLALGTRSDAEAPKVSVDIAPVYALVAQVMEGVGAPSLIVPQNASPHGYAMRPSEARALSQADIVFWVGETLTPWLHKPLDTLAENAVQIELMDAPGTQTLAFREGAAFDAHDHDHGHDDDHGHTDAQGHRDALDPHAWLDPRNGAAWLNAIAEALATQDPENAETYRANAMRAVDELAQVESQIAATLTEVQGAPFVVLHDAFHYFEARFGVEAVSSISLGDGTAPSAARLAEVRDRIQDTGASCILMEPEQADDLGRSVAQDAGMKMAVISPLSPLEGDLGPDSYSTLLLDMADAIKACLMPVS